MLQLLCQLLMTKLCRTFMITLCALLTDLKNTSLEHCFTASMIAHSI